MLGGASLTRSKMGLLLYKKKKKKVIKPREKTTKNLKANPALSAPQEVWDISGAGEGGGLLRAGQT